MSTKTTIKRVALVAAVALTLGGFSAVSASADTALPFYVSTADGGQQTSGTQAITNTATAVAGPYNFVELTADAAVASGVLGLSVSAGAGTISVKTQPSSGTDTLTVTGSTVASAGATITGGVIRIATPTVGSFTVSVAKNVTTAGVTTATALQTFNITVNAASVVGTLSTSASFGVLVDTTTANAADFAVAETATLTAATASSTTASAKGTVGANPTQVSVVAVRLMDTQPAALAGKKLTATITGAGLIAGTGSTTDTNTAYTFASQQAPSVVASSTTDAKGWAFFAVYSSGAAGVGTVNVSYTDAAGVSTVVSKTTKTFYGDLASLKVTQSLSVAPSAAGTLGDKTSSTKQATIVTGYDSAGNVVALTAGSITATSSAPSIAATSTSSCANDATTAAIANCQVTTTSSAKSGDAFTVTYSYTNGAGTVISSTAVPFTVGGTTIASLAVSYDAASYNPGDLVTMTITAKDSSGNAVADKAYAVFDTTTSTTVFKTSAQITSTPFGSINITTVNGKATATFYAPFTTGSFKMTAQTGASAAGLATALQDTALAGELTINGGADSALAVDAANAATDAANAAAEEASNATEAASEALAAVNSLATTVASLIAGIKAQLTSLTALIKKIQAKVKA